MTVPRCLSIAASDSGGGAGIQADLKAFAAAGCHGLCALTAVTAQSTVAVTASLALPVELVLAQLEAVWSDIGVDAVKTGMLPTGATVEVVASFLAEHRAPLVVDPVLAASTGTRLVDASALEALRRTLLPLATVITPNLEEARALARSGGGVGDEAERRELGEHLHSLGAGAVMVTGGDGREGSDLLFDGRQHHRIPFVRHPGGSTHGSGCTHSALLAALLARGSSLLEAAAGATSLAAAAVARGLSELGEGEGPVDVLGIRDRLP